MGTRGAVIIGGGLAGLTVAKELAKAGLRVTLLEKSDLLGGKAGARRRNGRWEDHGYHFFPGWYRNARELLREIRCDRYLIDFDRTHVVRKDKPGVYLTSYEASSLRNMLRSLFSGVMPWHDNLLSFYYVLDLAATRFDRRAYLDRISALGFLRSRFYATEKLARYHHQTVLQAVSSPYYEISAMTLRSLFRYWGKRPSPLFSVLNGNLHEKLIAPFEEYVRALGAEVRPSCGVSRVKLAGGRVVGLVLDDGSSLAIDEDTACVLAVPIAAVFPLIDQPVLEHEIGARMRAPDDGDDRFGLADLIHLRSAPMAAWHLHLSRRIPDLPAEHVVFAGSRFHLSFIDLAPHWGLPHTTLSLIASNFHPLCHLDPMAAKECLVHELLELVPSIKREDLPADLGTLQPHIDEPLFINTVGAWHFRPKTRTGVGNLYITGDFCQSDADITTMESTVMSGMNTAGDILRDVGVRDDVRALPLEEISDWMLWAGKLGLLPLVWPMAKVKRWRERRQRRAGRES